MAPRRVKQPLALARQQLARGAGVTLAQLALALADVSAHHGGVKNGVKASVENSSLKWRERRLIDSQSNRRQSNQ